MSKFQIIILSIFGLFIVGGVLIFSMSRSSSSGNVAVTVWGTIPAYEFETFLSESGLVRSKEVNITYRSIPSRSFSEQFTEALATGVGPDLVIMPLEMFWKERHKIVPIPYSSVSERGFKETFIEEAEMYMGENGLYALPLVVDPLVLYYNRDHLSSAGIARPIVYWDESYSTALALTKKDGAGNLTQSAFSLGEARNISNSKSILSLLMLQAGTPITGFVSSNLRPLLTAKFNTPLVPGEAALDFYTQFSNPSKPYYSWNRSLPEAQTRFASGDLSYYVGFASELKSLRNKNPTLNFSVAPVPQSRVSEKVVTYGRLYGISISRSTRNPSGALNAARTLISSDAVSILSSILGLPPARRNLLIERPKDDVSSIFYESALQSRGWIDPDSSRTQTIFDNMIESVTSGRARTSEAVFKANDELEVLIR